MWLERPAEERNIIKKMSEIIKGRKGRKVVAFKEKKEKELIEGLTIARSLLKPRKTSCLLMDLRSAISLGSSSACSTALAT